MSDLPGKFDQTEGDQEEWPPWNRLTTMVTHRHSQYRFSTKPGFSKPVNTAACDNSFGRHVTNPEANPTDQSGGIRGRLPSASRKPHRL
ncbi:hypothetical protein AB1L88_02325 [Tautonia sp. JC769]|uniref:hypothetical protein n=1 Tax=Tautonia sp. JC769 TaxID=3232135 RepID=UPI00345902B2